MTMLTYTILTDPAPLEASSAGRQSKSTGTVYLLITNTGQKTAYSKITVTVPVGNGADHLTPDITTIKPKGEYTNIKSGSTRSLTVQPQGVAIHITDPGGSRISFSPGDYLVLTLENVTIAPTPGLAVLRVTEDASRTKTGNLRPSNTPVALVKTAPKEIPTPRDFHPDKVMVNAGDTITLSWEGPAGFTYEIQYPGGRTPVSGGTWSPPAPNRATTYTLIATDPTTQQQHFLTTTVQVSNPILETLTATIGIDTPRVHGHTTSGGITFTGTGVEISNNSSVKGTVTADAAYFNGVTTPWVEGPNSGDGAVSFPQGGLTVWRTGGTQDKGTVFADKANLNSVTTGWVQGKNTNDAWIDFVKTGLRVFLAEKNWERKYRLGYIAVEKVNTYPSSHYFRTPRS
ncbi:hypothetical protein [Nonomuraea diastatica]|uniref:Uncharacterized protein n=1 Tax=Nonomuraea diastatica TaxID=1848329 RepID=A0A4R4W304_9ACTN|nr:hypothetical protein [Nonomuraea diastatica]TDD12882.1 hypothetical protein E1294_43100 [Nonomuraea diastatica]